MKNLMNITLLLTVAGSIALGQPVIGVNSPASSAVTLSVIIPAKAKIVSNSQITQVDITLADVKRGIKEIPSASALTIWSNARNGFVLRSRIVSLKTSDGGDASGITVLGKVTGTHKLQPQFADFQDLYQGVKPDQNRIGLSVDLRLLIDPGTKPGLYQLEPEFSVSCL